MGSAASNTFELRLDPAPALAHYDPKICAAMEAAKGFWENCIVGTRTRSSLVITVHWSVGPVQPPDNRYGFARLLTVRTDGLPTEGEMRFDKEYVEELISSGTFDAFCRHQMAHVLGFGRLWWPARVIELQLTNGEPVFIGAKTKACYEELCRKRTASADAGVVSLPSPQRGIPVTNFRLNASGEPQEYFMPHAHWPVNIVGDELMTGCLAGDLPLSTLTLCAMEDIGYLVDHSRAESAGDGAGSVASSSTGSMPVMKTCVPQAANYDHHARDEPSPCGSVFD